MTLEDFAARAGLKRSGGGGYYRGKCPHREDRNASFSAWEQNGWIRMRDYASPDDYKQVERQVCERLGITEADLRTGNGPDRWVYKAANGTEKYRKQRKTSKPGEKNSYFQASCDGSNSKAALGEDGRLLLHLPYVLDSVAKGRTIHICEGEKAAVLIVKEWAKQYQCIGTCQSEGGGSGKWLPKFTDWLRGAKKVVIWADRDDAGTAFASEVYDAIVDQVQEAVVVRSATKGAHDDAFDHITAGFSPEEAEPANDIMEAACLVLRSRPRDFQPVKPKYLIAPYLPTGKCILLDADGGTGKSGTVIALASALSNGFDPINKMRIDPITTLYLHKSEDASEDYETVALANESDPERLLFYSDREGAGFSVRGEKRPLLLDDEGLRVIERTIIRKKIGLVVLDALFYFMDGLIENTNDALPVMEIMQRLTGTAHRTGATFISIRHTSKGVIGKPASELGMGSQQFHNSHRGQLVMRFHPDQEEHKGEVVIVHTKASLLVPRGDPFAVKRDGLRVDFLGHVEDPFSDTRSGGGRPSTAGMAAKFLRAFLSGGPKPVGEIKAAGEEAGLKMWSLRRARQESGGEIVEFQEGGNGRGYWSLAQDAPPPNVPRPYKDNDDYDPFLDE